MTRATVMVAVLLPGLAARPVLAAETVVPLVVSVRPHDDGAFTQGLLLYDGSLYESTGNYGASTLREVDPASGRVKRAISQARSDFGEGLARVGNRLIQLTWKEKHAWVYDLATFSKTGSHTYSGEGWGLCYDGTRLVMSDGSSTLTFRDPSSFESIGSVEVTLDGGRVGLLNELECVGTEVYANVWRTNNILRINSATGAVETVIDASGLLTPQEAAIANVLNGIAYDAATGNFLVTGKYWPKLFELDFSPQAGSSGDRADDPGASTEVGDTGHTPRAANLRAPTTVLPGCDCSAARTPGLWPVVALSFAVSQRRRRPRGSAKRS